MVFALLLPWSGFSAHFFLHTFAFLTVSMLAVTSHMRTMLTDPGAVPVGYSPEHLLHEERGESLPMCSRCNGFKPPRAHHCSQCNRCVMKMDHHCPWVNNCVGVNNQKHFVLFCFYTCTLSCYAMLLLLFRMMNSFQTMGEARAHAHSASAETPQLPHARHHGRNLHGEEMGSRFILLMLLFMEALLFGLFTMAMLTEQLSSILSDQTGIERIKQDYVAEENRSWLHNLSETFGRPVSLLWLLPTTVKYNGLTWLDLMPIECEV